MADLCTVCGKLVDSTEVATHPCCQVGDVDVVSQLKAAAYLLRDLPARAAELTQSAVAVAELIEAANAIADQNNTYVGGMVQNVCYAEVRRLRIALAACRPHPSRSEPPNEQE